MVWFSSSAAMTTSDILHDDIAPFATSPTCREMEKSRSGDRLGNHQSHESWPQAGSFPHMSGLLPLLTVVRFPAGQLPGANRQWVGRSISCAGTVTFIHCQARITKHNQEIIKTTVYGAGAGREIQNLQSITISPQVCCRIIVS